MQLTKASRGSLRQIAWICYIELEDLKGLILERYLCKLQYSDSRQEKIEGGNAER